MNVSLEDAAKAVLHCGVLEDPLGFTVETGLTPSLEIAQSSPNLFISDWTAKSNTLCCNLPTKIKKLEDGFYLVCRDCEEVGEVELTCGVFTEHYLDEWVPHLLPPSWNMLEKSLYATPITAVLNALGDAILEAGLMLERADQQSPGLSYSQVMDKYRPAQLDYLATVAELVNGRQF